MTQENHEIPMKPKRRFKIEFIPPLLTLPFVGIFLYVLLSNVTYWTLINGTIGGVLGVSFNYIAILLALVIGIALISLFIIIWGIRKPFFLLKPLVLLLPTFFLIIFVIVLTVILSINARISLDYVFFMLGPALGVWVYVGISAAVFLIAALILSALGPLSRVEIPETEFSTKKPKARLLNPNLKVAMILITISIVLGFGVFLQVLFDHPVLMIYYSNMAILLGQYISWISVGAVLFIVSIVMGLVLQFNFLAKRKSMSQIPSGSSEQEKSRKYSPIVIAKIASFAMLCLSIILIVLDVVSSMPADMGDLVLYLLLILSLMAFLAYIPLIIKKVRTITVKSPKTRVILLLIVFFVPYWIVFYQPLLSGPPQVLLSSQTHMREINGVSVPFQGDTVYPSFEWQSDATRQYLNLSGEWKILKGERSSPYTLSPRSPEILTHLTQGEHEKDFDDSDWGTTVLPSAVSQYEDEDKHWGTIWYRKTVSIPAGFADRYILLKFIGSNYITDVWVDGEYLGYHEGGFTPFIFDVSAICTPGDHVFAIRVDNPQWDVDFVDKTVPDHCDFFNYGGIVREFYLEAAPIASIQRIDVRLNDFTTTNHLNGSAEIDVDVVIKCPAAGELTNPTATLNLSIYPLIFPDNTSMMSRETWEYADLLNPIMSTYSKQLELTGMVDTDYAASRISLSLVDVDYWSTKRPNLYAVMANLSWEGGQKDQFCTQTGFRNITVDETKLLLNGAPLKLAGVSRHEQYPAPTGRTLSDYQHFLDLALINSTGSNWWRGSYPFHPITYIHSDRLGLGCWEETPVFWMNEGDFIQGNTRNIFEAYWIEMVFKDLNRPSILFWGACNEPWAQGPLYEYLDESQVFLNKYDPSRLMGFACVSTHHWNQGFKNLRVCTPNTYGGTFDGVIGDYYGEIAKELDLFTENNPDKPLISMEWGMWRSNGEAEQVRCFEEGFRAFSEQENCQGMTWWLGFDYFGANYYNTMGIFNMERSLNWHSPTFEVMYDSYTLYTMDNL